MPWKPDWGLEKNEGRTDMEIEKVRSGRMCCGGGAPTTVLTQNLSVFLVFSKSKGRGGKSNKGEWTL